jgi:hypothetical protein
MRASWARISVSFASAGANCSAKSRYSKKFVFTSSLSIFGKSMAGARGRRPVQVSGKRLHLVAGLNLLLHVVEVFGVEKLGAISASNNCVLDRNTFLMPGGVAPFQSGPTTM